MTELLTQTARVISESNGLIEIEIESRSSCSQCSSHSCTTSVIARLFGLKKNTLVMPNSIGAKAGQTVLIGINESMIVRASLLAYLLPIVCMVAVTLIARSMGFDEWMQAVVAPTGLLLGYSLGRLITDTKPAQNFLPELLRIEEPTNISIPLNTINTLEVKHD